MAEELGLEEDAAKYEEEAAALGTTSIPTCMMKRPVSTMICRSTRTAARRSYSEIRARGKGCEGWLPLWAKVADQEQADQVVEKMMDEGVL